MVMKRVVLGEEPEERARAPDYWVLRAAAVHYFISAETAERVWAQLRRLWRPRWLVFVDLSGARIAVRSASVEWIGEATAGQRAFDRALLKALSEEGEEEARPWE